MPEFSVTFNEGSELTVKVEADDWQQAEDKAMDMLPVSICHQCTGWGQKWTRDLGESPEVIEVYNSTTDKVEWQPDSGDQS